MALCSFAKLQGDGYYRVQNKKTERYIYVLDDKGELNFQATSAELGAIELWKGYERTLSDPATIIYVQDLDGRGRDFDLQTQGTGVNAIIDYPVSIWYDNSAGAYGIFGRNSGVTRYIGDDDKSSAAQGWVTCLGNGEYYRWHFHPLTTDDSNYFGITPELQQGADRYATLYADFPFSFHSPGMTAYTVTLVADGKAYLKETEGTVAPGTPVIIKCSSATPSGNRLNIGGNAAPADDNLLRGVYFDNNDLVHKNQTPCNARTMRVLGKMSDGSIGFVTPDYKSLPRNKAYLPVPDGSPAEIAITTEAPAGISDLTANEAVISLQGLRLSVTGAANVEVYNITGSKIAAGHGDTSLRLPAPGLYIIKADSKVTKITAK